jgi:hypothetical protein
MKRISPKLLLSLFLVAFVPLVGCASTYNEMDKWMGHKDSEIISLWGAPSSVHETDDGKKILTWKKYNFNQDKTCTRSFTTDKYGVITAHSDLDCSLQFSMNFGNDQPNSK